MRIRWTGPDARDIALEGELVHAAHNEWVDVPTDTARSLAKQDGWELEASRKAARTRKEQATEPDVAPAEPPAEPVNEEN